MEILKAPHHMLSQQANQVTTITKSTLDLIENMKKTLVLAQDPEGVGLAAPQVGKSLQLFIIRPTLNASISVFINPQVTLLADKENKMQRTLHATRLPAGQGRQEQNNEQLEGCLSLQNIWGTVKRSPKVSVIYLDETGKKHARTFTKFTAVIIQHEFDHLNGILFPKRVLEQNGKLYKSKKDKQGKDVFEELNL